MTTETALTLRCRALQLLSWTWLLAGLGLGLLWILPTGESSQSPTLPVQQTSLTRQRVAEALPVGVATRNIEDLRVGDRVFALNPQISDKERETREEPDWPGWRRARLEMAKPNGSILQIDMIRPEAWFLLNQVEPGSRILLDLKEMGAQGEARVVSTSQCPPVRSGPGQVVTATFEHPPSNQVLEVRFEGEAEPIAVTDNHRFWSVDRGGFFTIGEMSLGEHVQTYHGAAKRIEQKLLRPGPQLVYNVEVYAEHVYFVGKQGILVHNAYSVLEGDADEMITLYHGTSRSRAFQLMRPNLNRSRDQLDFGRGFYVTKVLDDARDWANKVAPSGEAGAVVRFTVRRGDLQALFTRSFPERGNADLWDFVRQNRIRGGTQHSYDLVEGPYLGNVTKALQGRRDPRWYGHQVSVHTRPAVDALGIAEIVE